MLQMAVLIADKFFLGTFHALNPKGAREHHEGGVVSIFFRKRGFTHKDGIVFYNLIYILFHNCIWPYEEVSAINLTMCEKGSHGIT